MKNTAVRLSWSRDIFTGTVCCDMNGDDPLLLLDQLLNDLRPWLTVLKYAFYLGAGYGIVKCLQLSKEVVLGVRTYFLHRYSRRYFTPKDFRELYGKWAGRFVHLLYHVLNFASPVVTGATSAIGEAFAYEVFRRLVMNNSTLHYIYTFSSLLRGV